MTDEGTPEDRPIETIGQRLKRLRLEQGLSQRELACPGVSYAYISRIEAGTRQPSVKALRKLAAKLGVSVEYLEHGEVRPILTLDEALVLARFSNLDDEEFGMLLALLDALRAADRAAELEDWAVGIAERAEEDVRELRGALTDYQRLAETELVRAERVRQAAVKLISRPVEDDTSGGAD